jgi:hypothetical protein
MANIKIIQFPEDGLSGLDPGLDLSRDGNL